MQSFFQYRRFKRQSEGEIKKKGIETTASTQDDFPFHEIWRCADTTAQRRRSEAGEGGLEECYENGILSNQTINTISPAGQLHQGLTGVQLAETAADVEKAEERLFIVGFQGPDDPLSPYSWSLTRKWTYTFIVGSTGFIVSGASAFDTEITNQAAKYFGVSKEIELLNTSLYMIALGLGSLISAPFSETVGRNPVYVICLAIYALFIMAAGLAQNIQTQLVCRFLAALVGCPPITTFGGSMADMWMLLDRTYVFPIISAFTFIFPFLAPMVADFIATSELVSWRWTEWITMILTGFVLALLILFMPETYAPVLLAWKANHLRTLTGDQRYRAPSELKPGRLGMRLLRSVARPIKLLLTEPIVDLFSLYLVVVYIILFGFLPGYNFIFGSDGIYGFDQQHTGLCFIAMSVGFIVAMIPVRPLYLRFKRKLIAAQGAGTGKVEPEERLLFAMIGAPFIPISIFWMGWSSWPSVSYWSPIVATGSFGFGEMCVFISCYQYIIDTFEVYAASALVGLTVTRYCVAGPMVIVSVPMYENLGVHWVLTLLGSLSLLMTPVPYIFYRYGAAVRKRSRSATNFGS